ncbi:MAG: hypothetical protein KF841_11260 [Phycisphaerae bacterium]|nr:hypothetical protein [Phycisphaerae bacterium]
MSSLSKRRLIDLFSITATVGLFAAVCFGDLVARGRLSGPRAEGRQRIASLPEIDPSVRFEACFELKIDDATVGFAVSRVEGEKSESGPAYHYSDFSMIRGPSGARTELRTSGRLDRYFEPISIVWETTHRVAIGASPPIRESLIVDAKQATLQVVEEKQPKEIVVARPADRFIHPTGHLFRLLKLEAGQRFALRDFDTELKKFQWRMYTVTRKDDGRLRVGVGDARGLNEMAYYILDADGTMVQHGMTGVPFVFKKCDPGRIEELRKEWGIGPEEMPATAGSTTGAADKGSAGQ